MIFGVVPKEASKGCTIDLDPAFTKGCLENLSKLNWAITILRGNSAHGVAQRRNKGEGGEYEVNYPV
jgi:hypothetical protein